MAAFSQWCSNEAQQLHPVERAARIHGEFVKIHPFVDGNGRTSRLLMNLELMKAGFPATVIEVAANDWITTRRWIKPIAAVTTATYQFGGQSRREKLCHLLVGAGD